MKTIKFEELMKIFKKYVGKNHVRKAIDYVYFNGESFTATNAHVLLKVNSKYVSNIPSDIVEGSLYCPIECKVVDVDATYLNTDRLIPSDFDLSIRLNNRVHEIYDILKDDFKQVDKKSKKENRILNFLLHGDYMEFGATINGERQSRYILKHGDVIHNRTDTEHKVNVRYGYMKDALMHCKKLMRVSNERLEFNIMSSMRPIVLRQFDVFDLIILPVRVYN